MSVEVRTSKRGERTALRCPFCHESVRRDDTGAACSACRALHHVECFSEGAGCAACREEERAPEEPVGRVLPRRRKRPWRIFVLVALLGLTTAVTVSVFDHAHTPGLLETYPCSDRCFVRFQQDTPESAVAIYLDAALRDPASLREYVEGGSNPTPCLTRRTLDLLELEGLDAERGSLSIVPSFYWWDIPAFCQRLCHANIQVGRADSERIEVDDRNGHWLVDRVLANEFTDVLGVSLILPARLRPASGIDVGAPGKAWTCGMLTARIERATDEEGTTGPGRFFRAVRSSTGVLLHRVGNPGDRDVFAGSGETQSAAVTFVEQADHLRPMRYELTGPPSREDELVAILDASVRTIGEPGRVMLQGGAFTVQGRRPAAALGPPLDEAMVEVSNVNSPRVLCCAFRSSDLRHYPFTIATPGGARLGEVFRGLAVQASVFHLEQGKEPRVDSLARAQLASLPWESWERERLVEGRGLLTHRWALFDRDDRPRRSAQFVYYFGWGRIPGTDDGILVNVQSFEEYPRDYIESILDSVRIAPR